MFVPFFFFTSLRSIVAFITGIVFSSVLSVFIGGGVFMSVLTGEFQLANTFSDYVGMVFFVIETVVFAFTFWLLIDSMTIV